MSNGYAMPARADGIRELSARVSSEGLAEGVASKLRVGVHWSTQVGSSPTQRVAQVRFTSVHTA